MAKINFSETLTLASDKVSRNIYLQSISQGCMSMLPSSSSVRSPACSAAYR